MPRSSAPAGHPGVRRCSTGCSGTDPTPAWDDGGMTDLPPPSGTTYRICFVCTGNICRSPIAEVVLRRLADEAGLAGTVQVDSAGTGSWHVGDGADQRAVAVLESGGYDGSAHRARVFERA